MTDFDSRYDVLIVGARAAGASLALRLARNAPTLTVLVVDRADFPSAPAVPSCPVLYPSALKMLEELGVDEPSYADGAVKIESFRLNFRGFFIASMKMPAMHGRGYTLSVERPVFDHALWQKLSGCSNVATRSGFAVNDVVRDDKGRVIGVTGHGDDKREERLGARWVVAADGRYSPLAKKLGAGVIEERSEKVSTVYFADWEGVSAMEGESTPEVQIHASGRGLNVLLFPVTRGRITLVVHMRADRAEVSGDAQRFYSDTLASQPSMKRRMERATQVSRVVGIKRVGNGYRQAAGDGWFLAGDALHYKDPVDGQGIYDALVETKLLAVVLRKGAAGELQESQLATRYGDGVREATRPMFLETVKRLENELYSEPPDLVARTLVRWMLTDPAYQDRFLKFLGRAIPPEGWLPPSLVAGAALRGMRRDLRSALGR